MRGSEKVRERENRRVEKRRGEKKKAGPGPSERADWRNVWACIWECDRRSEKSRGAKNKPGTFFSQYSSTEAFHCQNHNRGFSDAAITSAGGNSVQGDPAEPPKLAQRTAFSGRQGEGTGIHTHTPTLSLGIIKAPLSHVV